MAFLHQLKHIHYFAIHQTEITSINGHFYIRNAVNDCVEHGGGEFLEP